MGHVGQGPRGGQRLTGPRGATGKKGPPGHDGRSITGHEVLEIVEQQIDHIHHELDVQMKRMAQLQAEVDELRATIRRALPASPTV
jgi:hypothetical protein